MDSETRAGGWSNPRPSDQWLQYNPFSLARVCHVDLRRRRSLYREQVLHSARRWTVVRSGQGLTVPPSNIARLRKICLSLPEATEVEAWGEPTFRIKRIFAMHASANSHHGDGRESIWVKTDHFTQDLMVHGQPTRYFVPPYVGPSGWTGVYLDPRTDWEALTDLLRDAYCRTAPKKLAARLEESLAKSTPSVTKTAKRRSAAQRRKVATTRPRSKAKTFR